jgi:hypothetical protein
MQERVPLEVMIRFQSVQVVRQHNCVHRMLAAEFQQNSSLQRRYQTAITVVSQGCKEVPLLG